MESVALVPFRGVCLVPQVAVQVIRKVHGGHVREALKGAIGRMSKGRTPKPLDQLRIFHTAEEELLGVTPLIRDDDRKGATATGGYYSELSSYHAAFLDLLLEWKKQAFLGRTQSALGEDRLREIRIEVNMANTEVIREIFSRCRRPLERIRELNRLEADVVSCLLNVDSAVQDKLYGIRRQINRLEKRQQELTAPVRGLFRRMRPRRRTKEEHWELKETMRALNRLYAERDALIGQQLRKRQEFAATMDAIMELVTRKKKLVMDIPAAREPELALIAREEVEIEIVLELDCATA